MFKKYRGGSDSRFLGDILRIAPPVHVRNIEIRNGDRVRIRRSGQCGTVVDFSPHLGLRIDVGTDWDEWVQLENVEKL